MNKNALIQVNSDSVRNLFAALFIAIGYSTAKVPLTVGVTYSFICTADIDYVPVSKIIYLSPLSELTTVMFQCRTHINIPLEPYHVVVPLLIARGYSTYRIAATEAVSYSIRCTADNHTATFTD